jgi:glyoxylase-like metal-dependent hydrolase (beta-lactamase superfamily II)
MADRPVAPIDPRATWDLPALGALPRVSHLDDVVTRILAPNPSPMTLDGTNTYVVGAPGGGEVIVVDPGPDDDGHLGRVEAELADRNAAVRHVVVTHHHLDHAEAAGGWAARFGCEVLAAAPSVAVPSSATIVDGDRIDLHGVSVEVVETPGHTGDHVSLRLGSGAVLCGDHVLGRGTSVVAHPDGDLAAYLSSLRRVLDLGPDALFPGHGPELTEDPAAVLRYYGSHRRFRQGQILEALAAGAATPAALVARIYADTDRRVWPAAEASTRAAIDLLIDRGEVRRLPDDRVALVDAR